MRRTILLALLAALLCVPSAAHAADPTEIIRDCADDDVLQGNYTLSELREARDSLPTDIDEYSACRDVLARGIADKTSSSNKGGAGGNGSGNGGSSQGGPTATSDESTGTPQGTASPEPTPRPAIPPGPPTQADTNALAQALNNGPQAVDVGGKAVSPGESRLAASVGRNTVPGSLFAVFGLLVLAGLAALGAPFIRRRVIARKQT